ncbi:enoyl-CoA hydratase/isomerase family protein [Xanthobacter pseudotagetidis]|uniref:enoyl-CoA hydratase/isomerase family protein n=1 Tax=Xanthobacter pseudotagetidis TaxID=3119911 RepID=UPI00372C6507
MTMETAAGAIRVETRGEIALVVMDNPGRFNALTVEMWATLNAEVRRLVAEGTARCLVLAGAGESFAAGADISEFERERSNRAQVTHYHENHVRPTLDAILSAPMPTVAMIRGVCMGGGLEIAAMCDIRIAAADARFGVPINRMGFPMALGETELLFKFFGRGVVSELLLEGRIFDAAEALQRGIVQRVVAPEALDGEAMATAGRIAAASPFAQRRNKEQLLRLLRDWSPVTRDEREAHYDFADTRDYRAGYEAFLAKQRPQFIGS